MCYIFDECYTFRNFLTLVTYSLTRLLVNSLTKNLY